MDIMGNFGRFDASPNGMFIHVPHARITGFVAINKDTLKISGFAYMDHTFQSKTGPRLIKRGHRYIWSENDEFEVAYLLIPKAKKFSNKISKYCMLSGNQAV